jgi:ATP-dependent DNA helicase RecG
MTPKRPINLNSLIHRRTIESERVEYKAGRNPDDCMDAGGRATQEAKAEAALPSFLAFIDDSHQLARDYVLDDNNEVSPCQRAG